MMERLSAYCVCTDLFKQQDGRRLLCDRKIRVLGSFPIFRSRYVKKHVQLPCQRHFVAEASYDTPADQRSHCDETGATEWVDAVDSDAQDSTIERG